jgi:CRP/FNR family transcriptional regulator, transcriptional activator FtrB
MSASLPGTGGLSHIPAGTRRADPTLLHRVPMFAALGHASLLRLGAIAELADIADRVTLCREGDPADKLHVLLDGMVTLSAEAANGRSAVVEVLRPVRHLVLSTVLAGLPYAITAVTIMPATLLVIGASALQTLLRDDPALASVLMLAQALDFCAMVREVCDLKLRTAAERLGCYLLELLQEQHGRNNSQLRLPIGKQLLAARIGCRHENLSRAFASLREFGVETHGKRVILHDIPRLREFVLPTGVATPKPS